MQNQHARPALSAATLMLLAACAAAAETSPPLTDVELQAREAAAVAGAVKASADAQAAANAAQLPSVGDLSKYKLDAPEVKLDATATLFAYDETGQLAKDIANAIADATKCGAAGCPRTLLLLASPKTRALLIHARAVQQSLQATQASLDRLTQALRNDIEAAVAPVVKPGGMNSAFLALPAAAVLPAIAAMGQAGVAFASALRSGYKLGGADSTSQVSAAFGNRVLGLLPTIAAADVLQVDAMLSPALDENSAVFMAHKALVAASAAARIAVSDALGAAQRLRREAPPAGPEDSPATKLRKEILARADALTEAAIKHNANADAVDKALAALATADAQGDSPLDQALRGGRLLKLAKERRVYTLSFALSSSKADVIAKNGLISGLKVAVASHSIAVWQLTDIDGMVVGAGSAAQSTKARKVTDGLF